MSATWWLALSQSPPGPERHAAPEAPRLEASPLILRQKPSRSVSFERHKVSSHVMHIQVRQRHDHFLVLRERISDVNYDSRLQFDCMGLPREAPGNEIGR